MNTDPSRRDFLVGGVAAATASSLLPQAAIATDDPLRELTPSKADLGSLFPDIEKLAEPNRYPASFLSGRYKSLEDFKTAGRALLNDSLSCQLAKVELNPEVVDCEELPEFVREKVLFSTAAGIRVPAYVHLPKKRSGPLPAVLDLHSHGGMFLFGKEKVIDFGKNHPVMTAYHERNYGGRPTATALVRRGYVVITIDAFMFGERRVMLDDDLKHGWDRTKYSVEVAGQLNQKCRAKESTVAKSLIYAGLTWPGLVAWDDQRTIDYLLTRPEVDPRRIACLGVSMGGWRALLLAGLEDRIAAACIIGFMSTVRPMLQRHIDTHSFVHFIPGLHRHLDLPDVASLLAPQPLLVQQCRQDQLFPPQGMQDSADKIAAAYEKAGVKDRFTAQFYDAPHRFDVPMQEAAFDWLDEQLKNP